MEHILLSVITLRSKDLAIGRARSDDKLIHYNQASVSNDRRGHGDQYTSLCSLKSGTEMRRIGLRININEGIGVSPPITTGSIRP